MTASIAELRPAESVSLRKAWLYVFLGGVLALLGLGIGAGGVVLAVLGGSFYYVLAGAALAAAGILLCLRSNKSFYLFALVYAATVIWAIWEAGLSFWAQVPRIGPFIVMGLIMSALYGGLNPAKRRLSIGLVAAHLFLAVAGVAAMFVPHGVVQAGAAASPEAQTSAAQGMAGGNWAAYGRDPGATHYVPFAQIDKANVKDLKVAWTFHTGEINDTADLEATPLQIGDRLYLCTAHNKVFAVDADTGRQKWAFDPKVNAKGSWNRCRGVGYFDSSSKPIDPANAAPAAYPSAGPCKTRIIATTIDARLFALDAETGKPCEDFGEHGVVDLKRGLGPVPPGWYYPTSAPVIAGDRILVGGWVSDDESTDEPGGVVRAFSAVTGKLIWAWDPGAGTRNATSGPTGAFVRSTPNYWGTATYDEKLGLVYVPTGNGTPDHWGGKRSPATDAFSTSVIALDVRTGRLVWHFQSVHHDLWDYDLSAPPTFVDVPDGKGGTIPGLVQVGKAAQIFLLDRRTGRPLSPVVERPVPQGHAPGDRLSPTQPYSVGMPTVVPVIFSEKTMWGATFVDQLACRIRFRQMHYAGQYTPPSTIDTPITPGYLGGMNWGGVAIDPSRRMMILNDIRLATIMRLVPRKQIGKMQDDFSHSNYELHAQDGTPYGVELKSLLSPIGIPCEQPPWGMITGVDLQSRKIAWQIPAGTVSESMGDMTGIHAPLPMGMPTVSSAFVTASGLAFYAGFNDAHLRAFDTATGRELWQANLPVGTQATPMSYVSPATHRQYVVTVAGGAPYSPHKGDYVIAYSLPH